MPTLAAVLAWLEASIPLRLAADWDNVGLLLGNRDGDAARVMACLTLTPDVADEAVERGARLVVSHHPILFKAAKRLTTDTPEGAMLLKLASGGVAVHSPHTAFDNAPGGINDHLAALLSLRDVQPLRRRDLGTKSVKLVAFVPESDLARVQEAMFAAGAGRIGEYSECGYRLSGTGTFRGSDASNPTVGRRGAREEVAEWRLETVCPESRLGEIVAALRKAHSYEEPAFDLYPLAALPGPGEGRVGELAEPATVGELAARLKTLLACGPVAMVGDSGRMAKRVAIACGAAGEFVGDAARARADVFMTGEARYHECLAAMQQGVAMLLPGHHSTERPGVEMLARRLGERFPDAEVWASERERDPVGW